MASLDRTEIAGLMTRYFPDMAGKSSDEWHGFMNEITGLEIPLDASNGTAFDAWRQKLAEQDLPVWPYTPQRLAKIAADTATLKARQVELLAKRDTTLDALRKEAPSVSARDLIEAAKRIAKGKQ